MESIQAITYFLKMSKSFGIWDGRGWGFLRNSSYMLKNNLRSDFHIICSIIVVQYDNNRDLTQKSLVAQANIIYMNYKVPEIASLVRCYCDKSDHQTSIGYEKM